MTAVIEFEEHSSVLPEWLGRRFKSRTLVYLDAHLDLQQISATRMRALEQCQEKTDAVRLEKPHFLCPDARYSFSIEDFLFAASNLGIVNRLIWVVPPHIELGYSEAVLRELQQSSGVTLEDLLSFQRSTAGWISGRLLGLDLTICNLQQLTDISIPEDSLLDIDIDFFLAETTECLWVEPKRVYERINDLGINFELITISRSIQSGFMPPQYRFVADQLAALFRQDAKLVAMEFADKEVAEKAAAEADSNLRRNILRRICSKLNGTSAERLAKLRVALEETQELSDRDQALAHAGLGLLACQAGDVTRAIADHSLATAFFGSHPQLAREIGMSLLRKGDHATAETFLREATKDDKPRLAAKVMLAQVFAARGNNQEAAEQLEAVLSSAPAWIDVRKLLATLQHRLKNHQKHRELLEECSRQTRALSDLADRLATNNLAPRATELR